MDANRVVSVTRTTGYLTQPDKAMLMRSGDSANRLWSSLFNLPSVSFPPIWLLTGTQWDGEIGRCWGDVTDKAHGYLWMETRSFSSHGHSVEAVKRLIDQITVTDMIIDYFC